MTENKKLDVPSEDVREWGERIACDMWSTAWAACVHFQRNGRDMLTEPVAEVLARVGPPPLPSESGAQLAAAYREQERLRGIIEAWATTADDANGGPDRLNDHSPTAWRRRIDSLKEQARASVDYMMRAQAAEAQTAAVLGVAKAAIDIGVIPYTDRGNAAMAAWNRTLSDLSPAAAEWEASIRADERSIMRGPPEPRIEAMRKRARALIKSDPVAALANVATALAYDEVEERLATARAETRSQVVEEVVRVCERIAKAQGEHAASAPLIKRRSGEHAALVLGDACREIRSLSSAQPVRDDSSIAFSRLVEDPFERAVAMLGMPVTQPSAQPVQAATPVSLTGPWGTLPGESPAPVWSDADVRSVAEAVLGRLLAAWPRDGRGSGITPAMYDSAAKVVTDDLGSILSSVREKRGGGA